MLQRGEPSNFRKRRVRGERRVCTTKNIKTNIQWIILQCFFRVHRIEFELFGNLQKMLVFFFFSKMYVHCTLYMDFKFVFILWTSPCKNVITKENEIQLEKKKPPSIRVTHCDIGDGGARPATVVLTVGEEGVTCCSNRSVVVQCTFNTAR